MWGVNMSCCVVKNKWFYALMFVCSIVLIGAMIYYQFFTVRILDFNYARDSKELVETFKADFYWLVERPPFDPEFMMRTHSPHRGDPRYYGQLHIKVLRDHGKLAGFVTYYKLNSYEGRVQFLSVNHQFRGKGYGKTLLAYAVQQLFDTGSLRVTLTTRPSNIWAQRIYTALGFKGPIREAGGLVGYTINKGVLRT